MCVLWLPLASVKRHEGIAWVKGSHLWNKLFLRTRFREGYQEDGEAGEVNGKTYHLTPDILNNQQNYEFLEWDFELGDCVFFDMRTLHGNLNQAIPDNNVHRYTLRMAKEGSKVEYRGTWAQAERTIMEANGYQNGDDLSGGMFPTLYEDLSI
jgi:ectoine hydroxylase-related dioxygenase (phytanoyl-CoA dioxygenase family)